MHGLRLVLLGAGLTLLTFAVGALLVGPVGPRAAALAVWAAVIGVGGLLLGWAWRRFRSLRGSGAARLLAPVSARLASEARSAMELGRARPPGASEALAEAHRARVARRLARLAPRRVVRWGWLTQRSTGLGAVALAVAALLLSSERAGAGAYALTHLAVAEDGGVRRAAVFRRVRAHLVYPSYLGRAPEDVVDPHVLEVPLGTTLEVRATPQVEHDGLQLRLGDRAVEMEREGGVAIGRVVVRADGELRLRLRDAGGEWVEDPAVRTVRALPDEAPTAAIVDPLGEVVLDAPEVVTLAWMSADDVGLRAVELVVEAPGVEPRRRRLVSFDPSDAPFRRLGEAQVDLRSLALEPGDRVVVAVEAKDGDEVSGPNVGRSNELVLTLASEATRRAEQLDELRRVLDRGLGALADRLETSVPEDRDAAAARFATVQPSTRAFADALGERAEALRQEDTGRPTDIALMDGMARRVRRALSREAAAHRGRVGMVERRRELDDAVVEEIEDDVLRLDDLLTRARVEDAAQIARELEALRQQIHSLLEELRRTDAPEARAALLEAIARAEQRMRDLMARIQEMGTRVPAEFMNPGELTPGESADALAELREAVQRGDLEAADGLLTDLERRIDQLARALGSTEQGFVASRFGPREQAMAQAMDDLAGLEAEQRSLAQRGAARRSRAAERALEGLAGADGRRADALADGVGEVRRELEGIDPQRLAGFERDAFERARERLRDTEDALRTGDLGEARRMARAAAQDLRSLSRDLDLSALMFPGAEGERGDDAQRAQEAERELRGVRRQLDQALPDVGRHLRPEDRAAMGEDARRQRQARGAAERLAETFGDGPDGDPLVPDAARELEDVTETLRDAESALKDRDPLESSRLQEEAARRLTELRQRLERQQEQQRSGDGGGGRSAPDFRQPVEIPGAEEHETPMEVRRRILDGMREGAPQGYEDAVRRYYEGLLR